MTVFCQISMKPCTLLLLSLLTYMTVSGQVVDSHSRDSLAYCEPSIEGAPRAKGVIVKREIVTNYRIDSSDGQTSQSAEVEINRRWELKARVPLILRDHLNVALGINYSVEEFRFENADQLNFPFYKQLESRSLKSLASNLYIVKPFRGNKYIIARISGSLNGDYEKNSSTSQFLKVSITPLLGWKKDPRTGYGAGLSLNYRFGRRTLVPVFFYERMFNQQWGVEMLLPVMFKLRYGSVNQKNYWSFKTELNGNNYNIDLKEDGSFLFLNKSEVRFLVSYEREIHDWLWLGVESGLRANFNFDLTDSPARGTDPVIANSFNEAFVFNFSVFLVPPRKFFE